MIVPENIRFKKTRIAPTPSGYLHLGNLLSFIITVEIAKKTGAKILLRIDDLDRERSDKLYIQDIFDTLDFMEIAWDEGPQNPYELEQEWSQVHRMKLYNNALQQLIDDDHLFACTCSRAQVRAESEDDTYPETCLYQNIPFDIKGSCLRLKTDANKKFAVKTLTTGVINSVLPPQMGNFIVRKKDGYPAYQLTSLIDDLRFGVDIVVRGEDLWPSTLAQMYLSGLLGTKPFKDITFHHHPLLMTVDNKKLSKSAGHTSVKYLRDQGKTRQDIYRLIGEMCRIAEPVISSASLFDNILAAI